MILFSNLATPTFHFPVIYNILGSKEISVSRRKGKRKKKEWKYQTSTHSVRINVETKTLFETRILLFVQVKTPKEIETYVERRRKKEGGGKKKEKKEKNKIREDKKK